MESTNTEWVTQCCRRSVKLDDLNPPHLVYCPQCESQDAFAVPATHDDEPEISIGCSEMHGPGWKDLSDLEEKIDQVRTRNSGFRKDMLAFLEAHFNTADNILNHPPLPTLDDLKRKYL